MTDCPTCELRREIEALTTRLEAMIDALKDEMTCRSADILDLLKVLDAKIVEFAERRRAIKQARDTP